MVSRPWTAWRAAIIGVTATLASGCELNETTAPDLETRAVVHAVLNPAGSQHIVIVERTQRSSSSSQTAVRDAITDARVVVYGPRDDSVVATHDAVNAGVYRLQTITITDGSPGTAPPNVLRIRPGERYRLRVETRHGIVVGETTVPRAGAVDVARRTFNVDRDTLRLTGAAPQGAAGYLLRHETRVNTLERFVTRLDAPLLLPLARVQGDPDDASWEFSFAHGLLFPGQSQNFVVVAVDSNYFRYYVAGFDPFGDDTRGNTLTGGVGLFGSVAPMMAKTLDLTADVDTPVEGSWIGDRTSAVMPFTMTLYSSPHFPAGGPFGRFTLSGRARTSGGRAYEALGFVNGADVSLDLVDASGSGLVVSVTGQINAGVLVLTDTRTGERVTYRK